MKGYFVYLLCDELYGVVYVGSTTDLNQRISKHKSQRLKKFSKVVYTELLDKEVMLGVEQEFIKRYKPKYNKQLLLNTTCFEEPSVWYEMLFPDPYEYDDNYIYEMHINYLSESSGIDFRFGTMLSYLLEDENYGCSFDEGKVTFVLGSKGISYSEFIDKVIEHYQLEDREKFSERYRPVYRREF
jgi:predicted GIY-YIG superfamily endonuclease